MSATIDIDIIYEYCDNVLYLPILASRRIIMKFKKWTLVAYRKFGSDELGLVVQEKKSRCKVRGLYRSRSWSNPLLEPMFPGGHGHHFTDWIEAEELMLVLELDEGIIKQAYQNYSSWRAFEKMLRAIHDRQKVVAELEERIRRLQEDRDQNRDSFHGISEANRILREENELLKEKLTQRRKTQNKKSIRRK
jgi:hypothetical protein